MTSITVRAPRRTVRFWAVELIPQYLLGLATAAFVITKLNAVRSAAESLQAVAILTVVGIAWFACSFLLMPWLVRNQGVRVVLSSAAAVGLAWALFANAYDDKHVVERLAGLAPATEPRRGQGSTPVTTLDVAPPVPVRVRSAAFRGINHRASGTASIIRQADGSYVIGLEDI